MRAWWILIPTLTLAVLTGSMLPTPAAILFAAGTALILYSVRGPLERWVYAAMIRRQWGQAERDSKAQVTRNIRVKRTRVGDQLDVRIRRGCSAKTLEQRREELAGCLRVREVRVKRDDKDASRATVTLVRKHAFDMDEPVPWPWRDATEATLWEPIPIGVDEHARPVHVSLVEKNMLIGGVPGAGKSVALSLLCAAAALDPDTDLWLMDGKNVELPVWEKAARRYVPKDRPAAIKLLRELQDVIEDRYAVLLEHDRRKIQEDDGHRLHLLVVDELAEYLLTDDKEEREAASAITELLRSITAKGRAAGVIVVAATQKPDAETVASRFRDLITYRLALRCATPQASDTILGQGYASAGFDASKVPNRQRGVGWLMTEDDPIRVRGYWLSDDDLRKLVARSTNKAMA